MVFFERITMIMEQLGSKSWMKGFNYARSCVMKQLEVGDDELNRYELYDSIASEFSTTTEAVEKMMRETISGTWGDRDKEFAERLFGRTLQCDDDVPNSSLYTTAIAEWLLSS